MRRKHAKANLQKTVYENAQDAHSLKFAAEIVVPGVGLEPTHSLRNKGF